MILCVLPRRLPCNPLMPLLNGYEVAGAATATEILRLARKRAYDGYVIHSPLGWLDAAEACRHIRGFDPNTPLIVYTTARSAAEKRDVIAAGAQAYVAHSDDVHNLPGTAGQLIMLAELRSLDAMAAGGAFIREKLVGRLSSVAPFPVDGKIYALGYLARKANLEAPMRAEDAKILAATLA